MQGGKETATVPCRPLPQFRKQFRAEARLDKPAAPDGVVASGDFCGKGVWSGPEGQHVAPVCGLFFPDGWQQDLCGPCGVVRILKLLLPLRGCNGSGFRREESLPVFKKYPNRPSVHDQVIHAEYESGPLLRHSHIGRPYQGVGSHGEGGSFICFQNFSNLVVEILRRSLVDLRTYRASRVQKLLRFAVSRNPDGQAQRPVNLKQLFKGRHNLLLRRNKKQVENSRLVQHIGIVALVKVQIVQSQLIGGQRGFFRITSGRRRQAQDRRGVRAFEPSEKHTRAALEFHAQIRRQCAGRLHKKPSVFPFNLYVAVRAPAEDVFRSHCSSPTAFSREEGRLVRLWKENLTGSVLGAS